MKTQAEVLQMLAQQKSSLLATYPITKIGIFGSYARGEQTETSDVDILVDYSDSQPPTLPKLIQLRDDLSQLLALKVDVVTPNGLKARIRDRVLAEVIYL
jgi:uncharacterized protein